MTPTAAFFILLLAYIIIGFIATSITFKIISCFDDITSYQVGELFFLCWLTWPLFIPFVIVFFIGVKIKEGGLWDRYLAFLASEKKDKD